MSIDVYINFNGNCREAVEFYAQVFGLEAPHIMTFADTPFESGFKLPEEAKHLVMHTQLKINGSNVMFADVFPGMSFREGNNINLAIVSEDIEKIKSYFNKLKDGGVIRMDLQETTGCKCYGNVIDKFGMEWICKVQRNYILNIFQQNPPCEDEQKHIHYSSVC